MGYQTLQVVRNGVNTTTNKLELTHFGEFFGVMCFAIEGIGLLMPIRGSMRNPQKFRKLFHRTAFSIVTWYFLFGASGAMVV